ncbi:hypothetical protein MHBO_001023 [Bonamia ostreae]|uniref:Uncharacterized protein n=1 Tax=Bonamia ostreae TaxID=126728 RepID=A0ABV2AHK1_9EUKA
MDSFRKFACCERSPMAGITSGHFWRQDVGSREHIPSRQKLRARRGRSNGLTNAEVLFQDFDNFKVIL